MDLLKGHDWAPNDRSIDNQVVRLRKLVEPDPRQPKLIKTVRGAGYSFTPERIEGCRPGFPSAVPAPAPRRWRWPVRTADRAC